MENIPLDDLTLEAAKRRARLNELPALIAAAEEHGGRDASRLLRTEKGHLDTYVPALEAQAHVHCEEAHRTQIAQCEQELLEAEATLQVATRLSHAADQGLELQQLSVDTTQASEASAVEIVKWRATVEMHTARHNLEAQRLNLAQLRVNFPPEEKQA